MLDADTLVILGGDLNSRTIMPSGLDILTETLRDRTDVPESRARATDAYAGNAKVARSRLAWGSSFLSRVVVVPTRAIRARARASCARRASWSHRI